jgi:hypothetical protein
MKNIFSSITCLLFLLNTLTCQDIRFSFEVVVTSASTSDIKVYASTIAGTENLAGYTVYFYYNNAETTAIGFDSSPTTAGLGWGPNNESNILFQNDNNTNIGITHTGYFFYQNIDNTLAGDDITMTPIHLLSIHFDHTIGTAESGDGWLTETDELSQVQYTEFTGSNYVGHDVIVIGIQSQALPVELVALQAQKNNKNSLLTWETSSELNSDHFDIEHSTDGKAFQKIGQVDGAGTTHEPHDYYYTHVRPGSGIHFYRLKQVDFDDQFDYTHIVSVDMGSGDNLFTLSPNPNNGHFTLNIQNPVEQPITARLIDSWGQVVWEALLSMGVWELGAESELASGIYSLQIMDGHKMWSEKVVVQK